MVIPCYNEEAVLPETIRELKAKFSSLLLKGKISSESRVVFVNDGSKDKTWEIIEKAHEEDNLFSGVCLSRNRGHQNALLAGLMTVRSYADITISMDADLQDDINAIDEMIDKYANEGCDIVYGVRSARKTDSFFKKYTAEGFYKFMKLLGADIVYNHSDYRLMSKRALDGLAKFEEVNLFLRGLVPMIGYKSGYVYYERKERYAGESKYPLSKMIFFALQGITSLSVKPIGFITLIGILILLVSIVMMLWSLYRYFHGETIEGWTSLMISEWFIGGGINLIYWNCRRIYWKNIFGV